MDDIGGGDLTQVRPRASRRQLPVGTRLDFWLDAVILVSYIFAYSYGFTGDAIHEWLGLALGLVLLVHLTLHSDWVVRITRKLFGRRGHDRVIWLVNLALLFGMTLCIVSGIVISRVALPSLGFFLTTNLFWNRLHILTAEITLGLVPVHAALRWRWIAGVGRRLLPRRTGGVAWEHSSAAGWITPSGSTIAVKFPGHGRVVRGGGIIRLPPGAHPPPGAVQGHVIHAHANAVQLDQTDIGNLTSTAEIVVAAMAGVIVLEIARRRVWRARRAARLASARRRQAPLPRDGEGVTWSATARATRSR